MFLRGLLTALYMSTARLRRFVRGYVTNSELTRLRNTCLNDRGKVRVPNLTKGFKLTWGSRTLNPTQLQKKHKQSNHKATPLLLPRGRETWRGLGSLEPVSWDSTRDFHRKASKDSPTVYIYIYISIYRLKQLQRSP